MTETPTRTRVPLPDISSRTWEHPADRGALVALRRLKGFDVVLKRFSGLINERAIRMVFLGSSVRVSDRQYPDIYRLYTEAAATLDVHTLPELYIQAEPTFNAMAIGMDRPIIVVTSGLVDLLDEEELRFVLGHELGHVLSGHAVYQTMLQWLVLLSAGFASVPLGGLVLRGIMAALMEWARKAELSADRAGLLAGQDPPAAVRTQMKLASGGHLEQLDTTAFFEQGREYANSTDLRDSVLKLLMLLGQTHPFAVVRATELRSWVESGEYARILAGDYPRRQDDDSANLSAEAQAAAKSYADAFNNSQDGLTKLLRDVGEGLGSMRDWVGDKVFGSRDRRNDDRD